jgi:isoquinoline 1-oxidoreductase beta subunit
MTRVFPQYVKDGIDPTSVEGAVEMPYGIPAREVRYALTDVGVPVGFWRSVGNSQNAFFVESFIDELAAEAGVDPVAFRLSLLEAHPRHRAVLERAAALGGWGTPPAAGRSRGVALHESFGSIVAEVVEIALEGASLKVHHVACAVDCGVVVNPDTVVAQMKGGIVYGLTGALFGRITIEKGRVVEGNFDTYPMLHLAEAPAIDIEIIASGGPVGGVGEPSTPPVAPALANAIFAATGTRIRTLPIAAQGFSVA